MWLNTRTEKAKQPTLPTKTKKMLKTTIKILLLLILTGNLCQAQNKETDETPETEETTETTEETTETTTDTNEEDVVYLKNGSILRGEITEKTSELVKIKILGGSLFVFQMEEVKEIEREEKEYIEDPSERKRLKKIKRPLTFRTSGWYNVTTQGFLPGINAFSEARLGFTLHHVIGYQFNNKVAVGAGMGLDVYGLFDGEAVFNYYVDYRGYLTEKSATPYYGLALGYGKVIPSWQFFDIKGGAYIQPAIGIRCKSRKKAHFIIEYGLKMQKASYTRTNWFWDGEQGQNANEVRNIWFRRSAFKIGVLF